MPDPALTAAAPSGAQQNSTVTVVKQAFQMEVFDKRVFKIESWITRLERAFLIFGIERQLWLTYLLHYIGIEAYDILADEMGCSPDDSSYVVAVAKLSSLLKIKKLILKLTRVQKILLFRRKCLMTLILNVI